MTTRLLTFNEFCTLWGICDLREDFHAFTGPNRKMTEDKWIDLWLQYLYAEQQQQDAADLAETQADTIASSYPQ